jgi:hypothetical protein
LDLLGFIRPNPDFQRVMANPNEKTGRRLITCANCLKRFSSAPCREAGRGPSSGRLRLRILFFARECSISKLRRLPPRATSDRQTRPLCMRCQHLELSRSALVLRRSFVVHNGPMKPAAVFAKELWRQARSVGSRRLRRRSLARSHSLEWAMRQGGFLGRRGQEAGERQAARSEHAGRHAAGDRTLPPPLRRLRLRLLSADRDAWQIQGRPDSGAAQLCNGRAWPVYKIVFNNYLFINLRFENTFVEFAAGLPRNCNAIARMMCSTRIIGFYF